MDLRRIIPLGTRIEYRRHLFEWATDAEPQVGVVTGSWIGGVLVVPPTAPCSRPGCSQMYPNAISVRDKEILQELPDA